MKDKKHSQRLARRTFASSSSSSSTSIPASRRVGPPSLTSTDPENGFPSTNRATHWNSPRISLSISIPGSREQSHALWSAGELTLASFSHLPTYLTQRVSHLSLPFPLPCPALPVLLSRHIRLRVRRASPFNLASGPIPFCATPSHPSVSRASGSIRTHARTFLFLSILFAHVFNISRNTGGLSEAIICFHCSYTC